MTINDQSFLKVCIQQNCFVTQISLLSSSPSWGCIITLYLSPWLPWPRKSRGLNCLSIIDPAMKKLPPYCNTLPTWCKELTHLKRPWCWGRLRARREGADRGWDGWMASPTPWTWVWAGFGRWWGTGTPGVLPSMGSQRVRHAQLSNSSHHVVVQWGGSSSRQKQGHDGNNCQQANAEAQTCPPQHSPVPRAPSPPTHV